MSAVEFFWDPVCPWAWITSRWILEVQRQRPLEVEWRPIALRIVNEEKDYERDFPEGYERGHRRGLELLRVADAAREAGLGERVIDLYTRFGTAIHVEADPTRYDDRGALADALGSMDLPRDLAAAADDGRRDEAIRASTREALTRCGGNVGTPVISWSPPDGPSFFGPVISRVPQGDDAVRLWDAVTELGANPWFAELKRSVRERPQVQG